MNLNDPHNRLSFYGIMLKHWSDPAQPFVAFCPYLESMFGVTIDQLPELMEQRTILVPYGPHYHFPGTDERGRLERVEALKRAIVAVKQLI